jgi:HAMP domain-containing protein
MQGIKMLSASNILNRFKLSEKLNIILIIIILIIVGINGLILSQVLQKNAEREITTKAALLIETMGSVRDYTSNQVNPELAPRLETEAQFLPQTVPGYSAREVFEYLRKREQYNDFFYKEATLNPTNLRDKADKFESTVVNQFRDQPNLKELSGFRSFPGGDIYYVARPIAISNQTCLRCHSTPEAAPKSQLTTYGRDNGFNWKLNEIVGAKIVSVPASNVLGEARRLQFLVLGILAAGCLIALIILNLFLRFSIIKPITNMAQWSREVSTGNMHAEFEHPAKDEIGMLATSVNRLKVSLEMAMNMLNPNQNKENS